MNTPQQEKITETVPAGAHTGTPPLCLLPSWLFFSETIDVEIGSSAESVREQASLQIESVAPIPPEQLLSGFRFVPRMTSALCYAAARERLRERLASVPAGTLHVIPAFALWESDSTSGTSRREWFATDEELTALLFEHGKNFPKQITSWEISRGNASDEEFYAKLNAMRAEKSKEFADNADEKNGIYILGKQTINKKTGAGTIEVFRLNEDGAIVPAARTLDFATRDNSLWFADVRDAETLSRERKERKNIALMRKILNALGVVAILLLFAQVGIWAFKHTISQQFEIVKSQEPTVKEIQSQAKLIDDISKIQENKLQLIRSVAVLNAQRPQGVGFTNFSGNGTTGAISITGNAETIALANEFEKNIRSCGIFKGITFSANMASNGTNFSLQCTPIKTKLAEINFYENAEETVPAQETEEATETPQETQLPAQQETTQDVEETNTAETQSSTRKIVNSEKRA